MVLQTTTPLALSTRASAMFLKRLMVPSALRYGAPSVSGFSSMEPRFLAALASVCFRVQVIGLMAMAPGCTTGLGAAIVGASVFQETMTPVSLAPLANLRYGCWRR